MKNSFGTWIVTIATVLLSAFISGCGTSNVEPGPPPTLVTLSITPVDKSIAPGTTAQLTATGTFSNGSIRNITTTAIWNSSDTSIATFNNAIGPRGLATALTSIGTTTITAVSSGITGMTTLSTLHVSSIAVAPLSPLSIAPGTTQQYTATGTLTDSTTQNLTSFATWTTTVNPTSGTVSDTAGSKGLATAGSTPGTATIQAAFDGATGSATLTSSHVHSILVTSPTVTLPKGLTQQFTATGTLADLNSQNLTTWALWTSSSPTVATISNTGLANALALGSTNISAFFDSITSSPTVTLTVTQPVLLSIAITPNTPQSIALGLTKQYTATGTYSDGSTPVITSFVAWKSSQPGVASIDGSGLATSVAQGTTTITASMSGVLSNSATLHVTQAELVSITVSPPSASITPGTTQQFTATGTYTDGSTPNLTTSVHWDSSKISVATISSMGLATAQFILLASDDTNITATFSGITSNTAVLTVHY